MNTTCSLLRRFIDDRPWYSSQSRITAPQARRDVRCEWFGQEAVLYDSRTGNTFCLNATALFVWERCRADLTVMDIAQALAGRYGISLDRAADDVEQVLAMFAQYGLLETYRNGDPAP